MRLADTAARVPGPDREAENGELRSRIEDAILRLPDRQRAAVVLFEVEGLKITEVAELMDCSEGAVKSTLHRARRRLRDELREYIEEGSRI
jgi:RNA polymerase sigma-70 factor (ECF subfamily)